MAQSGAAIRSLKSGSVRSLYERWTFLKEASPERYGGSYFKNAWAEIPEVVFMGLYFGIFGTAIHTYKYKRQKKMGHPMSRNQYKDLYIVLRPDDPRVQMIRKDYYLRHGGFTD